MLIYAKHYGQMCNRLWSMLPSIAFAIERKVKLNVLFARKDYIDCFPKINQCIYIRFLLTKQQPPKWAWRICHFSEKNHLEIEDELRSVSNVPLVAFIDGWAHSSDISFINEHRNELTELFQPSDFVKCRVLSVLNDFDGLTVGVHVRRGDYKGYLGGKYYYEDNIYGKLLIGIKKQIENEGKSCRFLICSNEPFVWHHSDINIIRISNADGITDLYALSKCDYIIGPPSSYSQWASFIGKVPAAYILNRDIIPVLKDFSYISYFNKFENGKVISFNEDKQEYTIL